MKTKKLNSHGFSHHFVLALVVVVAAVVGVYFLVASHDHDTTSQQAAVVPVSCAPISTTKLTETVAIATYKSFTRAVKQSNQSCADSLSSVYFKQAQSMAFPGSDGNWISVKKDGIASVASRLAKLPPALSDASFTQSAYGRALTGTETTTTASGITLSYPFTGSDTIQYHLKISFILQSGKVLVDDFIQVPASLDTQTPTAATTSQPTTSSSQPATTTVSKPTSSTPVSTNTSTSAGSSSATSSSNSSTQASDADKSQATANVKSIAIYLEEYYGDHNAYTSDLNSSNFTAYGPDPTIFTPPAGTKYAYTPNPGGCTTSANNCQHFTLSAVTTSNNTVIDTEQSQN